MAAGFRLRGNGAPPDAALIARFAAVPVACVSDSMHRLSAGGVRLRPLGTARMAGPAVTVKTAPGDNLMVHKALDMAPQGAIVVIDAGGDLTNAILGERMYAVAVARGLAGLIVDGAVRDAEALRQGAIPVFAAGVTHRGPYKNGPGEVNYPIAIDGMVIKAGDIIVADEDGFVSVPAAEAESICVLSEAKHKSESDSDPVHQDRSWVDDKLRRLGCEFVEG